MSKKLKILCLHGCRQDKKVFNEKSGHLRKVLKKYGEFEYISAPHGIKSFDPSDEKEYKTWWYTSADNNYDSKVPSEIDQGFEESVKYVEDYVAESGPFDGILAFSQGASLLGMICLMIERKEFVANIDFVILISGFKSPCVAHQKYYSTKVNIPSLHVIGDNDSIIFKDRSEDLMTYFVGAKLLRHPGGHHVPAAKEQRETYLDFFKEMLALKEQKEESVDMNEK